MRPKLFHSEHGFALAKVMIFAGIGLAITAGSLKLVDSRLKVAKILNVRSRMDMLQSRVENSGTSLNAFTISSKMKDNPKDLKDCLSMNGTCDESSKKKFELYNSFGNKLSGRFDINGNSCTQNCVFRVTTEYRFKCSSGTSCSFPEIITTEYEIRHIDRDYTGGFLFKPITGKVDLATYLCPNNQIVRGIDANGKFICDQPSNSMYSTTCAKGAAYGITPEGDLRCADISNFCSKDIALVTVIDTSGSMYGSSMNETKKAAQDFLKYLKTADQIGLVNFDDSAYIRGGLTSSFSSIESKISMLDAYGVTNMDGGLLQAKTVLKAAAPTAIKGIIFLSDGWYNVGNAPFSTANLLKADGVNIWTIALSTSADVYTLRKLASTPDDYFYVAKAEDLKETAFKRISEFMCRSK